MDPWHTYRAIFSNGDSDLFVTTNPDLVLIHFEKIAKEKHLEIERIKMDGKSYLEQVSKLHHDQNLSN